MLAISLPTRTVPGDEDDRIDCGVLPTAARHSPGAGRRRAVRWTIRSAGHPRTMIPSGALHLEADAGDHHCGEHHCVRHDLVVVVHHHHCDHLDRWWFARQIGPPRPVSRVPVHLRSNPRFRARPNNHRVRLRPLLPAHPHPLLHRRRHHQMLPTTGLPAASASRLEPQRRQAWAEPRAFPLRQSRSRPGDRGRCRTGLKRVSPRNHHPSERGDAKIDP